MHAYAYTSDVHTYVHTHNTSIHTARVHMHAQNRYMHPNTEKTAAAGVAATRGAACANNQNIIG